MRQFDAADLETLGRKGAVDAMRAFLREVAEGRTASPPRVRTPVLERTLVFTIGGVRGTDLAGFRLYSIGEGRAPTGRPDQLLALMRLSTGEILATASGAAFGAWRTAALGAVAMQAATDHLARPVRAAVLGAGFQAHHHARTWAAARRIACFQVWTRRHDAAAAFAEQLQADTGVRAMACSTANDAVDGADAVLGVTRSAEPVVAEPALPATVYLATVGPKFGGRHELPGEAYARADVLFSDAVDQCADFEQTVGPLPGGRTAAEMLALPDIVAGRVDLPTTGRRLFVSEGVAGSEVALLGALYAKMA